MLMESQVKKTTTMTTAKKESRAAHPTLPLDLFILTFNL